jgi:hypothetical protein
MAGIDSVIVMMEVSVEESCVTGWLWDQMMAGCQLYIAAS